MQRFFTTRRLCRAAVIAALYAVIAIVQPYSSTPVQCRLSEALTVLPLFFPEAVPGLFIGCFLANVMNGAADMILGSLATLIAATSTCFIGRAVRNAPLRLILGILPPIVVNALLVPVVFIINGAQNYAYFVEVAVMAAGQAIAIGVFGTALYFAVLGLRKKGVKVFCDDREKRASDQVPDEARDGTPEMMPDPARVASEPASGTSGAVSAAADGRNAGPAQK